jgi:cobalt-precorrin-6B (C15)-methyltransferase
MISIDDKEFIRGEVPMTKQEIRTLTLAKAKIDFNSVIVDVGAGTGSITIEAAKLAPNGKVFAIEKNPVAVELIKRNVKKFSAGNVKIICAEAPDSLENLPELDAAIIGGSSGHLEKILDILYTKLKIDGRIVLNAITIQTLANALDYFKTRGISYETIQVQITHLKKVGAYDMNLALNPVWIITAEKF